MEVGGGDITRAAFPTHPRCHLRSRSSAPQWSRCEAGVEALRAGGAASAGERAASTEGERDPWLEEMVKGHHCAREARAPMPRPRMPPNAVGGAGGARCKRGLSSRPSKSGWWYMRSAAIGSYASVASARRAVLASITPGYAHVQTHGSRTVVRRAAHTKGRCAPQKRGAN